MSSTFSSRTFSSRSWVAEGLLFLSVFLSVGAACYHEPERPPPARFGPTPEPDAERAALVERAVKSGPLPGDVAAQVQAAANEVFSQTLQKVTSNAPKSTCYAAGCVETFTFPNRCTELEFDLALNEDPQNPLFRWPAGVLRLPPKVLPTGAVEVTWILAISNPRDPRIERAIKPPVPKPPFIHVEVCPGDQGGTSIDKRAGVKK
jgi:hypothetical protein